MLFTKSAAEIVRGRPSTSGDDYQLNVGTLLRHAARSFPEREVVSRSLDGTIFRYSYGEALRRVERLANALLELGIRPGDRVGVVGWNTHHFYELYFALAGVGAVLLQVNPRISAADRSYVINHSEAKWLFVNDNLLPTIEPIAKEIETVKGFVVITDGPPCDVETTLAPRFSYDELLREASEKYDWPMIDEQAAHSACYTSGTTGRPKAVYYSHRCSYLHTYAIALALELSQRDTVMQLAPMFHGQGWGLFFGATLVGAKLVLPGRYVAESLQSLVDLLVAEKVTRTAGAPAIFMPMLEYFKKLDPKPDLRGLRLTSGSSEPPLVMMKGYHDLGAEIIHGYGATEAGPMAAINHLKPCLHGLSADEKWELQRKQGLPVSGIEVTVVGADGKEVPHDGKTVGEVWMRGLWVTREYHNDPQGAAAFERGYWRSGDAATIDEYGYLKVTDRFKDLIKSGGEWISSIDMQNMIVEHPAVLQAAVVGLPHPKWLERPLALVVLREGKEDTTTKEDILGFLTERFAKWQLPDDIVFVESIPATSVGKVAKVTIREMYKDYYSREAPAH